MKKLVSFFAFSLLLSAAFTDVSAQSRKGFEIGIGPSLFVANSDDNSETGFGAHLTLAYGINERFTLGINGAAGVIDEPSADDGTATASVGGIFGRLYFSPNLSTRPYLTFGGGIGSYEAEITNTNVEVSGPAGMIGIGFDHMNAGSKIGFFGEVNYNLVSFEEVKIGGITFGDFEVDVDYIVFAAGLRFRIN